MTRVYLIHSETGSRIRHSKFKKANRGRHSRASGADPSNIYWIFDGSRLIRLVFSLQKVISRLQRGHDKRRNRSAALPLKVLFQRPRDIEKKNFDSLYSSLIPLPSRKWALRSTWTVPAGREGFCSFRLRNSDNETCGPPLKPFALVA